MTTLWTPANLPKAPIAWWDAQDTSTFNGGATDGSSVTQWTSKGSSKFTLVPGSGTPTYALNAIGGTHPAMKTGNYYEYFKYNYTTSDPIPTGSAAHSVFSVWKSQLYSYANEIGWADRYLGDISSYYASPHNSDDQWSTGVLPTDRAVVGSWVMDAGTTPKSGLYLDGSLVSESNRKTYTTPTSGQVTLGNNNDGDYNNWGLIGEYFIFDYVLSYDDRQRLEGFLSWKWGLNSFLNTDHPYYNAPPTADPAPTGSGAWTPDDLIIPASVWFDPTSGMTVTGGKVTSWKSRVGNASAAYASKWSPAPTTTVNSVAVPIFNGSEAYSITDPDGALPVAPTPVTIFVVASDAGSADGASPISWGQTSDAARRSLSVGGGDYEAGSYTTNYSGDITWQGWYIGDMASTTTWGGLSIVSAAQAHGSANDSIEIDLWKNATLVKSGLRRANAPTQNSGAWIGAQVNSTPIPWVGTIAEILVLNYFPSAQERQFIEGYLAWRWGLQSSLPTTHAYRNAAPTYGTSAAIPTRRHRARYACFL